MTAEEQRNKLHELLHGLEEVAYRAGKSSLAADFEMIRKRHLQIVRFWIKFKEGNQPTPGMGVDDLDRESGVLAP